MTLPVEGTEIARGATAVVRAGAAGTVVKELLPGMPAVIVELEARALAVAGNAGLRVPRLMETRLEAEPPALVMSRVNGVELADAVVSLGPEETGQILADAQDLVRRVAAPDQMLTAKDYVRHGIDRAPLPSDVKIRVLGALSELPDGDALCHLDLHPRNILWDGAATIIDWNNGTRGDAAADVARTLLLLEAQIHWVPAEHRDAARPLLARQREAYRERTEQLAPGILDRSLAWRAPLAAMMLGETPPPGAVPWLEQLLREA